jgi:quinoprotein dehydrogenase-associated probable ABC transporter substrate-binding protein
MLPYSNQEEQGYENKIAELFAKKMGVELEYTWFPQRIGFIRNTLTDDEDGDGKFKCDLVISVPDKFELAATTEPYYTTTYMLVFVKGRGLDEVTNSDMFADFVKEKKPDLKFGLADTGAGQNWVFYNDLLGNMVPYQGQPGDPKWHPGQKMIDELVAGKIDATIAWGPTAGYYAEKYKDQVELVMLPLNEDKEGKNPNLRFKFSIAMGVRYADKEWKAKVNQLIEENKKEIDQILADYGIPLVK